MRYLAVLLVLVGTMWSQTLVSPSDASNYRCFDGFTSMTVSEVWNEKYKYFDFKCEKGFEVIPASDLHRCAPGKIFGGGMSTTDYVWPAKCWPTKIYHEGRIGFQRSMCGCCGMNSWSGEWSASQDRAEWDDKTESCTAIPDKYRHQVDGKWVEVSKDDYYRAMCIRVTEGIGKTEKVLYPKPEWTECIESK